jgi:hypothetical protein
MLRDFLSKWGNYKGMQEEEEGSPKWGKRKTQIAINALDILSIFDVIHFPDINARKSINAGRNLGISSPWCFSVIFSLPSGKCHFH